MRQIVWTLINNPIYDGDKIKRELTRAFKAWSDVSDIKFMYETNDNIKKWLAKAPVIEISFFAKDHDNCKSFDGKSGVLAHANRPVYYDEVFDIGKRRMHFDSDEDWCFDSSCSSKEQVLFYNVALHEIGHILGLKHNKAEKSIMYDTYLPENDKLSTEDVENIKQVCDANTPSNTHLIIGISGAAVCIIILIIVLIRSKHATTHKN